MILGIDYLAPITEGNFDDNKEGSHDEIFN